MVYKFRVFSDINEKFLRCIEIDEEDTFLSLHQAIQLSVNFTKKEMASFYLSNDLWDRLTQITLMDVRDGEADDIFSMEQTTLNEFMTEEGENLVYVYDFISDRVFYLVLSEIKNRNMSLHYPLCSQTIGDPPVQTIGEKRTLKGVVAGKVITNVKKTTIMSKSTVADKSSKDVKKVDASKAKASKTDGKVGVVKVKASEKATVKGKAVEAKKVSKVKELAKPTSKVKKGKSIDDDNDEIDLDDDLDLLDETPKKGASKVAKKVAKPVRSRSVDDDDEDFDDDDDENDDEELIDDSLEEVEEEEDFNFDEDEFEKKFKSESSIFGDFEEEEEDFFDDQMFDNIDDYADRI